MSTGSTNGGNRMQGVLESQLMAIDGYGFTKLGTPVVVMIDTWSKRSLPFIFDEEQLNARIEKCQQQGVDPDVSAEALVDLYYLREGAEESKEFRRFDAENIESLIQKNAEKRGSHGHVTQDALA